MAKVPIAFYVECLANFDFGFDDTAGVECARNRALRRAIGREAAEQKEFNLPVIDFNDPGRRSGGIDLARVCCPGLDGLS